jgi:hypothetical protein
MVKAKKDCGFNYLLSCNLRQNRPNQLPHHHDYTKGREEGSAQRQSKAQNQRPGASWQNRSPGSEMGHTTHSVASAKPYLEALGAGRRRGHIYIWLHCSMQWFLQVFLLLWRRLFNTPLSLIREG